MNKDHRKKPNCWLAAQQKKWHRQEPSDIGQVRGKQFPDWPDFDEMPILIRQIHRCNGIHLFADQKIDHAIEGQGGERNAADKHSWMSQNEQQWKRLH
ncbi:hypothetical protein EDD53_0057 [Pacificibacter maritimus]|uniref:Uncharacterized protein n=1 Tax=Pacificibacter maritimus TaxID=762213 RepID=A0A3N4V1J8_9RHOB|nr:hypothetical protein EDD53_0057 [Pacificibacter maritimus]